MSTSKKIFLIAAAIFFAAVLYFVYDIASKTTFPGSKSKVEKNSDSDSNDELEETDTTLMKNNSR